MSELHEDINHDVEFIDLLMFLLRRCACGGEALPQPMLIDILLDSCFISSIRLD